VIWDARKIDDYTLHRRRFISMLFLLIVGIFTIATEVRWIAHRSWSYGDLLFLGWFYLLYYAARGLLSEYRLMKQSAASPEVR
jgi:hypothetical protein